jgi:hypothetical protein
LPTTFGSCTGAEKSTCFRRDESARTKWSCTGQSKYCRPNNRRWKNGRCGQDRGPAFRPYDGRRLGACARDVEG